MTADAATVMEAHFVTFYSPGTFVAETSTLPIAAWNTKRAMEMADKVTERYGATPYAFQFSTRARKDNELDSRVVKASALYYLGGRVETLAKVKARNDPKERVLVSNMEGNKWGRVITNENSWTWVQPLKATDAVLDYVPPGKRKS